MPHPKISPWIEAQSGTEAENGAMAACVSTWAPEMANAIKLRLHQSDEWPTNQSEAIVTIDGVEYLATLTFSLQPQND